MTFFIRALSTILLIAICATYAVDAQTRHRAPTNGAGGDDHRSQSYSRDEARSGDPADIALDRKISGICKGC